MASFLKSPSSLVFRTKGTNRLGPEFFRRQFPPVPREQVVDTFPCEGTKEQAITAVNQATLLISKPG